MVGEVKAFEPTRTGMAKVGDGDAGGDGGSDSGGSDAGGDGGSDSGGGVSSFPHSSLRPS